MSGKAAWVAISVMNWVWTHSRSRHGARLVLLAIADCASGDGGNAWPSVAELRRKAGLGERAVQAALTALVGLGELAIEYNAGPKGCNRYQVVMDGPPAPPAKSAPPQVPPPADNAPPQKVRELSSSQAEAASPADNAPPAESAPPQNWTDTPAESAPGTINQPMIDDLAERLAATTRRLAAVPGEDDQILRETIQMIHRVTGEVIDAARARAIIDSIVRGRRIRTDLAAYVLKAIRNEQNPRRRFLKDITVAAPKPPEPRQVPLLVGVSSQPPAPAAASSADPVIAHRGAAMAREAMGLTRHDAQKAS